MRALFLIVCLAVTPSLGAMDLASLPRTSLPEITLSASNEIEFVRRAGADLSRYSGRTGFEACADICVSPKGTFGILPVSLGAHAACSTLRKCPKGMRLTGKLLHSRPNEAKFLANKVDFYLRGKPYQPNSWWRAGDPGVFSEADYADPGYLIMHGQVWFQSGPGSEVSVGELIRE